MVASPLRRRSSFDFFILSLSSKTSFSLSFQFSLFVFSVKNLQPLASLIASKTPKGLRCYRFRFSWGTFGIASLFSNFLLFFNVVFYEIRWTESFLSFLSWQGLAIKQKKKEIDFVFQTIRWEAVSLRYDMNPFVCLSVFFCFLSHE